MPKPRPNAQKRALDTLSKLFPVSVFIAAEPAPTAEDPTRCVLTVLHNQPLPETMRLITAATQRNAAAARTHEHPAVPGPASAPPPTPRRHSGAVLIIEGARSNDTPSAEAHVYPAQIQCMWSVTPPHALGMIQIGQSLMMAACMAQVRNAQ